MNAYIHDTDKINATYDRYLILDIDIYEQRILYYILYLLYINYIHYWNLNFQSNFANIILSKKK